jgi:histone acetyltransferase (RNA polymerase elongator complex component)
MPKSYLKGEPAVLRAEKNNFDCVSQIWDRMHSLYMTVIDFQKK